MNTLREPFVSRAEERGERADLVPVVPVLLLAGLVVSDLTVDEEDGEVGDVEVRDGGLESAREGPGPAAEARSATRAREEERGQELTP